MRRLLATAVMACAALAMSAPPAPAAGLVVDSVEPGYAADMAGLRAGDLLVAWREERGQRRHGPLLSPFTLDEIAGDALIRGPVTLEARRGGRLLHIPLPADAIGFEMETHPRFAPDVERLYRQGRRLVQGGDGQRGTALWRQAAARLAGDGPEAEASRCFLLARIGEAWADLDGLEESRQAFAEAQECVERRGFAWTAALLQWQGRLELDGGHHDFAEEVLRAALDLHLEAAPRGLSSLGLERALFSLAARRGHMDEALERIDALVERCRREVPGSLALAEMNLRLAWVRQVRGEPEAAEPAIQEAISLAERAGPDTATWVSAMSSRAGGLLNAGLPGAEHYFRLAYERQSRWAPEHVDTVRTLINMAAANSASGDVAASLQWLERAVRLADTPRVAPTVLPTMRAVMLGGLAAAHEALGRPRAAAALNERALRAVETAAPGFFRVASIRARLGRLRQRLGEPDRARALVYSALDHCEVHQPGSPTHGLALLDVGEVSLAQGDLEAAEEAYAQAVAILEPMMPMAPELAQARAGQARVALRRGGSGPAEGHLRAAVVVIESGRQEAGRTDEARALFASRLYGVYQDLVDLLAGQGRVAEAFEVLEQSHARALLALLAERRLLDLDLPPELEAERKRLDTAYDRARRDLEEADDGPAREKARARLLDLRDRQQGLAVQIRQQAPGLASFRYPQPLAAAAVAALLDPGTLLIAYSVGGRQTVAFALAVPEDGGPFALRSEVLPLADAALRRRAGAWRRRLESGVPDPALAREARALYDLLLRPFAPELARARRLVLVPDGPLHGLPFAALHDGTRFLVQALPSSVAPSATLAAQWAQGRGTSTWGPPVLFADPGGSGAVALPGSRAEAAAIADRFPASIRHVGHAATEERAKALARGARFVHFAVHGVIDASSPLDSGLALRAGGREPGENGLLQAWEILERLRLDTDLVTLSACRSAYGAERAGEGTMGLVRAFQYAGARSVLASLWSVGDRSTAELMRRFYTGMASGKPKADALRTAQQAAIRRGWHPARWASFQLYGDWN
jgi:CHAT domain-containing protein